MRALALMLLAAAAGPAADLQALYDRKQLFDVRDAVFAAPAPPFFRAAVACSFHDRDGCVRETKAFLATNPPPKLAIKAWDRVYDLHFARGEWDQALAALDAEVALGGPSEDPDNVREMLRILLRHGPVTTARVERTRIRVLYKHAHVPITLDGHSYRAYLDTGANVSVLSESAAKRLGLTIEQAAFRFGGSTGHEMQLSRLAIARRFTIGNIELRNVPFVVVPDNRQPFASWGAGKRCILGLQVLLAARTISWRRSFPGVVLELGSPGAKPDLAAADLCFDGMTPLIATHHEGRRLTVWLDTGAGSSVLHAGFASAAPARFEGLPHFRIGFEGVDGKTSVEAVLLRGVALRVGGRDTVFRRLPVYLKGHNADAYDGMFGNDLARKACEFRLDFEAMRVLLR